MYILRVEVPLLWVEYDEADEKLSEGDIFTVHPTLDLFQVEDVIPLVSGGVILALKAPSKAKWPRAEDHVKYLKIRGE